MALVQFTSVAGAPFIMFEESAKKVFSEIGETWTPEGGFPPEDLDGVLARLEEARERDKERHRRDKEASVPTRSSTASRTNRSRRSSTSA